jgi:hypothetical protein
VDQIFNELSVSGCYPNRYEAREGMENVIALARSLRNIGMSPNIRTTLDFQGRSLTAGYTISHWGSDRDVDPDLRRYVLTFATKAPFIESFLQEQEDLIEYFYQDTLALGLGLACIWEGVSLSLAGDKRFLADPIQITQRQLIETGEIQEELVSVCTLCGLEQVEKRADWIRHRLKNAIHNGKELIEKSAHYFPHLSFCRHAIDQLHALTGNEQFFPEIVRHFFALEKALSAWHSGPFVMEGIDFSSESEPTMNNPEYKKMRMFLCPDREKRTFTFHTKIKSANKRIYFYPSLTNATIYIGYVGPHLPTTKHPT